MDRRLPPLVADLATAVARLRRDEAVDVRLASSRAVLLPSGVEGEPAVVGRLGRRRIETAGDLDISFSALTHRNAAAGVDALIAAGCDVFLVDRRDHGLEFGIAHSRRRDALAAVTSIDGPGWFLEWADGRRCGVVPLADAANSRRVTRARSWRIFRAWSWGDRAVGQEQAVEIGFWHPGTSGQLERVGTRGQARFDERAERTTEIVDGHEYPGRSAFPVGEALEHMADPVDIVFTWVDGGDTDWQDSFRSAAHEAGRQLDERGLDGARYEIRDELRYALRSVWANCGWARNIFIVTAGQTPDWFDPLDGDDRIRIVDHTEIFPPDALPTFNSHSIEASLHKIDGLAERFVYFNDDMFVRRPTRPETFFTSNGLARVFQSDACVPAVEDHDTLAVDTAAMRGRDLLRERFGRVVSHKPLHSPYPLRRSVIEAAEGEFAEVFDRTVHSRFRSPSDLSIAASFAQHYALATGAAVLGEIASEYVHVESSRLGWHLDRIRLGDDLDTFCINATQSGRAGQAERDLMIAEFFESCFPIPSPWERRDA